MDLATIVGVWSASVSVAETERERKRRRIRGGHAKAYFLLLFFVRWRVLEDPQHTSVGPSGFGLFAHTAPAPTSGPILFCFLRKLIQKSGRRYFDLRQGADNRMTIGHEAQQFLSKNL